MPDQLLFPEPRSPVAARQDALATGNANLRPREPSRIASVCVLAAYALLGIIAFWPMLPGGSDRLNAHSNQDAAQSVWFFEWSAHALTHGLNPFITHLVNVPVGLNLAQATAIPLLGLIFAPVTLLAGPVSAATLCVVVSMPISATAAYFVLRRWHLSVAPSAIGGLLYGFSPYSIAQAPWHPQLAFIPLPPLIVAAAVRLVTRPRETLRNGVLLGLLSILQYLISAEVLAMTGLCCLIGLALACLHLRKRHKRVLRLVLQNAAPSLAVAGALFAVVLAYPLWLQFAGPRRYHGMPWAPGNPWFADPLDLVVPSPQQAAAPWVRTTGSRLTALVGVENGVYIGVPVLLITSFLVFRNRYSLRIRVAAETALISILLSLGARLHFDGHNTGVPLPFGLLVKLPGLQDILPIRFGLTTALCLAGIVAIALDRNRSRLGRESRDDGQAVSRSTSTSVLSLLVCGVFLVSWWPNWPYASEKVRVPPQALLSKLPGREPVVLTYPYPLAPDSRPMLWQASSGMRFRLVGAYALMPGPTGQATTAPPLLSPVTVQAYLAKEFMGDQSPYPAPPSPTRVAADVKTFLATNGIAAVMVDTSVQNAEPVSNVIQQALGPPRFSEGGFVLWVFRR